MSRRRPIRPPVDEEEARLPDCLRDPRGMLARRWREMLAIFAVAAVAAAVFVHLRIRTEYLAEASVLVSSQGIETEFVASPVRDRAFEKISAIVGETLSSESLAEVIEAHDLYAALRQTMSMAEVAGLMRKKIEIEPDESVGPRPHYETARVFTVSFRARSADTAAIVANDLADRFAEAGVRLRGDRLRLTSELLEARMEEEEQELAAREKEMSSFRKSRWRDLSGDPASLETRIAELRDRLNNQLSRYTSLHPEIEALQREIGGLSARLERMHLARERMHDLDRQVRLAEGRLLEIEGKVLEAQMAHRLDEASERSVAVLDRAQPAQHPERTPAKFFAAGVFGALGLAAAFGVLREYLDPVVLGADQIEETFGLTVLGGVTRIR